MKKLSVAQLKMLHQDLIAASGGSGGIRDQALLESALYTPFQAFADRDLYPSVQQKAARLAYGLINNHPFVDGNKRIGAHAMLVFLSLNGIELRYRQEELIEIIFQVAQGADEQTLLQWIVTHQV